jgi:hypothetical protein
MGPDPWQMDREPRKVDSHPGEMPDEPVEVRPWLVMPERRPRPMCSQIAIPTAMARFRDLSAHWMGS